MLTSALGNAYEVKKMTSGDLLVEVETKMECHPLSVTLHQSLNCVRGIISDDLLEALDQVHLNILRDKGVKYRKN